MAIDGDGRAGFRVLFVCTGNLCRSPMAELMLRSRASEVSWLSIASAGTAAVPGAPMDLASLVALKQFGGAGDGFSATRLSPDAVRNADLVLSMARDHRAAVARAVPAATRKSFAFTEFCRLSAAVAPGDGTADDARRVVGSVRAQRGVVPPVPGELDDIVDPIQRPRSVVQACARQISGLVDDLTAALGLRR